MTRFVIKELKYVQWIGGWELISNLQALWPLLRSALQAWVRGKRIHNWSLNPIGSLRITQSHLCSYLYSFKGARETQRFQTWKTWKQAWFKEWKLLQGRNLWSSKVRTPVQSLTKGQFWHFIMICSRKLRPYACHSRSSQAACSQTQMRSQSHTPNTCHQCVPCLSSWTFLWI